MISKDSKTNFALLRDKILQKSGKEYWRSVEEFVDAPEFGEFVKEEYPQHAEEWDNSLSRRKFITIMGASLALAGLSGCVIQPEEKIVPYVNQPEGLIPGKPLYYATAMTLGGIATGLLAKSTEGRPTKLEGNPDHPGSLGATDVLAQAALLEMYDPDRSQSVTKLGLPKTWQSFLGEVRAKLDESRPNGGDGIRFLTETITSPTLIDQFKRLLLEFPKAKWYQYDPINQDNVLGGAKLALGSPVQTIYKYDQADRVLSLDADIFSGFNTRYIRDFSKKRGYNEETKDINRLYVVETRLTLMGAKADHRLAVKPSQVTEIAKAIAKGLGVAGATSTYTENAKWIEALVKDLQSFKGKSIVVAGESQPPIVHATVHAINSALGNIGTTIFYIDPLSMNADLAQIDGLKELIRDIDAGSVKTLIIMGGNPVYNTPADLKLAPDRMQMIPLRIHLGSHMDETGALCHWQISEKHFLEMWSDTRAYDGTVSLVQPLVQALYDSKSAHEFLQVFFKENFDKHDLDIVKEYWQKQGFGASAPKAITVAAATTPAAGKTTPAAAVANTPNPANAPPKNFEDSWRKVLHDGFAANTAAATKTLTVNTAFFGQAPPKPAAGGLEISIVPDPCVYDGRFTNNGWLQELPNPLTKITWENVALVSPKTAAGLKLNQTRDASEQTGGSQGTSFVTTHGGNLYSDLVTLKFEGGQIAQPVPIWIAPGQPDEVITIFTGYGRTKAGKVGTGLGYNTFDVQKSGAMWSGSGEVTKTGEQTQIASTQTHFNMEGRDILRVFEIDGLDETLHSDKYHQHDEYENSMYPRVEYNDAKWGMSIDLNSCVGCNACVLACQSENNIPVVGKEQIARSREMHWMRIDAYYTGDDLNSPEGLHFQPMLCQQCEQAPCEVVCPVHATVHSAEGLNDMVYNRCIGTRYCSNNCPYKVRRFNFLLYQDWTTPQYKLMRNPEVTVRSRGVMEKCTYCTQRISFARIEAQKDGGRKVRDGEIVTACQSICPTQAITFGDLNDETSRVAKLKKDRRNYVVLNDLNTQPRTTYLAGLKNQNKEMPDYVAPKKVENHKPETKDAKEGEAKH